MTATAVQRRRGTAAQHASFTGLSGELTIDQTNWRVVIHDGVTPGGKPQASEAYVQAQIGAVTSGAASNFTQWMYCT
jgi:hypothetical protein